FLAVHDRVGGEAHLADLNVHLIDSWRAVRDDRDELQEALQRYRDNDSRDFYYSVRASQPVDALSRAARFLYLNSVSWNHLWRENSKTGAMNVPWGDRPFRGFADEHLAEVAAALQGVSIEAVDFRAALA